MNICIYRIMRNQWYSQAPLTSEGTAGIMDRVRIRGQFFSRHRSTTLSAGNIQRGASHGHHEAEYKKRDAQYTRASVFMVVAFVVCNMPRFIPNVMEIFLELDEFPQASSSPYIGSDYFFLIYACSSFFFVPVKVLLERFYPNVGLALFVFLHNHVLNL